MLRTVLRTSQIGTISRSAIPGESLYKPRHNSFWANHFRGLSGVRDSHDDEDPIKEARELASKPGWKKVALQDDLAAELDSMLKMENGLSSKSAPSRGRVISDAELAFDNERKARRTAAAASQRIGDGSRANQRSRAAAIAAQTRARVLTPEEIAAAAANDMDDQLLGDDPSFVGNSKPRKNGLVREGGGAVKRSEVDGSDLRSRELKGFLELNPYICSGCGSNFQTRDENSPGFLPKDKFASHMAAAETLREKQRAIRLLTDADVDLTTPVAAIYLEEAGYSREVIDSIVGVGSSPAAVVEAILGVEDNGEIKGGGPLRYNFDKSPEYYKERKGRKWFVNSAGELIKSAEDEDELHVGPAVVDLSEVLPVSETNINTETDMSAEDTLITAVEAAMATSHGGTMTDTELSAVAALASSPAARSGLESMTALAALTSQEQTRNQRCVCQRCFRLQEHGTVRDSLRPGWSNHELLTTSRFETLLSGIKSHDAVVLCLVDLFDLEGSILPNLAKIAGKNPVVIGVNKVDLLPADASTNRVRTEIYNEIKNRCGFVGPPAMRGSASSGVARAEYEEMMREVEKEKKRRRSDKNASPILGIDDVHLISTQRKSGVKNLVSHALRLAESHGKRVYVLGAANVGKSSFLNRVLEDMAEGKAVKNKKMKRSAAAAVKGPSQVTVSSLPGTTLDFLKVKLDDGITLIDTPGLIDAKHLTTLLTSEELRDVLPKKTVQPITARLDEGYTMMLGGLASVTLEMGRPFFFTAFTSRGVKLHQTSHDRIEHLRTNHAGGILSPPNSPERIATLGPLKHHRFEVTGSGWKQSAVDIVLPGLGWVAITGVGTATIDVGAIEGTQVSLRKSLLPFEAQHSTARFTGGAIVKKSRKPRT